MPNKNLQYKYQLRIVQANIGNNLKISSEEGSPLSIKKVYKRYFDLSTKNLPTKTDLIIWPETAFPNSISSKSINNLEYPLPKILHSISEYTNTDLFFGGYDHNMKSFNQHFQSEYNTAFLLSSKSKQLTFYHKIKLIPFGEGLPFGPLNKFLSNYINNISYFAAGDKFTLFKTSKDLKFTAAICYEILFTNFIRNQINRLKEMPQAIINLTNDSWYGDSSEPFQHLFLTKWRSLELQIPIIRSTNTGITSVLYPNGSEGQRLKLNEIKSLDVAVIAPPIEKTIYLKYGIWTLFLVVLSLVMIFLIYKSLFRNKSFL